MISFRSLTWLPFQVLLLFLCILILIELCLELCTQELLPITNSEFLVNFRWQCNQSWLLKSLGLVSLKRRYEGRSLVDNVKQIFVSSHFVFAWIEVPCNEWFICTNMRAYGDLRRLWLSVIRLGSDYISLILLRFNLLRWIWSLIRGVSVNLIEIRLLWWIWSLIRWVSVNLIEMRSNLGISDLNPKYFHSSELNPMWFPLSSLQLFDSKCVNRIWEIEFLIDLWFDMHDDLCRFSFVLCMYRQDSFLNDFLNWWWSTASCTLLVQLDYYTTHCAVERKFELQLPTSGNCSEIGWTPTMCHVCPSCLTETRCSWTYSARWMIR